MRIRPASFPASSGTGHLTLLLLIVLTLAVGPVIGLKMGQPSSRGEGVSGEETQTQRLSRSEREPGRTETASGRHGPSRPTLKAKQIREESKNSLVNCEDVHVREEFADCVINNLSLEFFFTAFVYYQKRFKKNYGSVHEQNRRFQIFMRNYQKILK